MKKLLLTALVMVMGGMNASAAEELYLQSNVTSWNNDDSWKITGQWDGSQDVYSITIPASSIGAGDFEFKFFRCNEGDVLGSYQYDDDYAFSFANGQNETYTANGGGNFVGSTKKWVIKHSEIKASEYKITVYVKYPGGSDWEYYIKVEIVSMPATISSFGYSTFSCAYALDLSSVTAYYAPSTSNNKVVLQKATGKVPAGTGLLLAGSGTVNIPVVETSQATALGHNYLEASVTAKDITPATGTSDYYYFLAGNSAETLGFYFLNPNGTTYTSGAGKAYLRVNTPLASETTSTGARASWIFQDNISTSISTVQNAQKEDTLYDLQGRIAKSAKAGLYIKNGKKFIVK